jgi:hypothetical protein
MRAITAACLIVLVVPAAGAQSLWTELPVPSAALTLLDVPLDVARPLAMLRAIRVRQSIERKDDALPPPMLELERLLADLEQVEVQIARLGTRGVSLSMAKTNTERDSVKDWCDVVGLRLRERRGVYTVEADRDDDAVALRKRLAAAGMNIEAAAARLNAGDVVTLTPAVVALPSPLPLDVWSRVVFERPLPARSVFGAVIRDRRAALLFHGLASMSAGTRAFVVAHPELLRHFYTDTAGAVAAFGSALRFEGGEIVLPGGADARALWEAFLDERLTQHEKVARRLFDHDSGRLAYFVHTIDQLDSPHRAFALGLWIKDAGIRLDRLRALYSTFVGVESNWSVAEHPFARPLYDPGMLLTAVHVRPGGEPANPAFRKFWDQGLDGIDLPSPDARLRDIAEDGFIDAAWLVERVIAALAGERKALMERLLFGQRVFGDTPVAALPHVLTAVRAHGRYPALMLLLERSGVQRPETFAAAARAALALEGIESPAQAVPLLSQFQGALGVLDRAVRSGALRGEDADELVTSLSALAVTGDGYRGTLLRWLDEQVRPRLPAPDQTSLDARVLRAIADGAEAGAPFDWEGTTYVPDVNAASLRGLEAVRAKQGGNSLDALLAVSRELAGLRQPSLSLPDVKTRATSLRAAAAKLAAPRPWPDLPEDLPEPKKILDRAVRDLSNIKKPKDLDKVERILAPVVDLVDFLLGETLMALAYAPVVGEASTLLGPAADMSHRHDFGLTAKAGSGTVVKRTAWTKPKFDSAAVGGQGLLGSAFGIDLTLAKKQLRRLVIDRLPTPRLNANDATVFTETVALTNPRELTTAELRAIGATIVRGRARVRAAGSDDAALAALANTVAMSDTRRSVLSWTPATAASSAEALFSMSELFWLGADAQTPVSGAWGTTHEPLEGCYCKRFPSAGAWEGLSGRPGGLQMGSAVPDLNLRVAELMAELKVPAALFGPVLAYATQDFIDGAPALYDDDWAGIVQFAGQLSRERIEDYVAALVAAGPVREADRQP